MASDLNRSQRIWRYRIFAITWLAYAGFYLCRRNFSVVMPLLERGLGYSNFQLANVIFAYSLLYSAGQFCFGPLADRFGSRLTVSFGLLLSIGATVLMGFVPGLAALTVLCCVNGLGQSAGWPGLVKNMAPWFRQRERGVVMGWWTTNYVIGGSLAVIFATFAATTTFTGWGAGWQRGFWFPAVLLLAIALLFAAVTRNRPADAGLPEIGGDPGEESGGAGLDAADPRRSDGAWRFFKMLGDLEVWTFALGCAFSILVR